MNHNNNNEKPTLEEMILRAKKAEEAAERAQIAYEQALLDISNTHGATYEYKGQVYQIRTKVMSSKGRTIVYLCKLKDWPSSWLSKGTKSKVKKRITTILEPTDTDPSDMVTFPADEEQATTGNAAPNPEFEAQVERDLEQVYRSVGVNSLPDEDTTTVID